MAQKPQIVDITKSYLPGDPNAYVQSLVNTDREDGEEKTMPMMAYDGYNFLPTAYGYKSFFGTNAALAVTALSSRVQFVLLFQTPSYKNRLIALCEDGIWVCTADGTYADWVQVVTHSFDPAIFEEWTWCVIENVLYMYKQGTAQVYRTTIGSWVIPAVPGALVGDPTTYQTFAVVEGATGSGLDFTSGSFYQIDIQYKGGTAYSLEGNILPLTEMVGANGSFDISISAGTAPVTTPSLTDTVRVYIYDVNSADTFYKDFLLSVFPISIPDYTGFNNGGAFEPQTLTVVGVASVTYTNDVTITSFVPSFLTMTGQMGIFRAGLRLGMWDSANSVSWSSNLDLTDFTPSIENLAGNTIFGRVVGRIVNCKGHGEGFIVYSTKSVVGVTFTAQGNLLWDAKAVLDNTGIANSRAVACGKTDSEHFLFGTTGIYTIGKYNALAGKYDAEPILPEVYDLLKESRDPIYLAVLQDRYLCFQCVDEAYIYGRQSFSTGLANPYTVIVDWFTPSTGYPTATSAILPEQLWEIVRQEMSGTSKTKRKDGEWVPRYNTTVDIMDDRYYSFWRRWIGEQSTRLSYDDYATYLDTSPLDITTGVITSYLNPERPAAPPDAARYGKLRTSTGIRAFWGLMGATEYENNEALIYGQEKEWEAFIVHQEANKSKIDAYSRAVITYTNKTQSLTFGYTDSTVVVGPTTTRTREHTYTYAEGDDISTGTAVGVSGGGGGGAPAASSTYNSFPVTASLAASIRNGWLAYPEVSVGSIPSGDYHIVSGSVSYTWSGFAWLVSGGSITFSADPTYATAVSNAMAFADPATTSVPTTIGTLVTGEGNNQWLVTEGPTDKAAKEVILRRTFNKGLTLVKRVITVFTHDTVSGLNYREIATATTTYETTAVTGTYGYSQFRAVVTHWDKVRFGLYGAYTILQTVAAEAMTAKIWEGTYPTDLGADRDSLWSYGQYKAIALPDLQNGTIGQITLDGAYDSAGTVWEALTSYEVDGITSLHSSYTLPGTSFTLQTGSIEAVYPTFVGALVYDFQLKKWGKYKGNHDALLETVPVNGTSTGTVTYTDLGVNAAAFGTDGLVYLFDSVPVDSWIRYGKIGFYRQGFTDLLEVRASMRMPSDFTIITESSMDGKNLDLSKNTDTWVYDDVVVEAYIDVSARWHTVKISGNYDLTGLEIRAKLAGRR